jgi:YD repeat-containing protein
MQITEPDPGSNQPGGIVTSFTYGGPAQRLDSVTDPEGRVTQLTFRRKPKGQASSL